MNQLALSTHNQNSIDKTVNRSWHSRRYLSRTAPNCSFSSFVKICAFEPSFLVSNQFRVEWVVEWLKFGISQTKWSWWVCAFRCLSRVSWGFRMDYPRPMQVWVIENRNVSKSDHEKESKESSLTGRDTHDAFLLIFQFSHSTRWEDSRKMYAWVPTRWLGLAC